MEYHQWRQNGDLWSLYPSEDHGCIVLRHDGVVVAYIQVTNYPSDTLYVDASTVLHTLPGFVADELREMDDVRVPHYD